VSGRQLVLRAPADGSDPGADTDVAGEQVRHRYLEEGSSDAAQAGVFDLHLPLAQVAQGYQAMDERRAIKVMLRP
jgi:hypothetical protein